MRPSSRLFLDPNAVYHNLLARQRATWLTEDVRAEVDTSPELRRNKEGSPTQSGGCEVTRQRPKSGPFPRRQDAKTDSPERQHAWELVAGVAKSHPRLLAWLCEGKVTWYWNLFGTVIAVGRLIPGVRALLWHLLFEPVARSAPWRAELYEAILQERRHELNRASGPWAPAAVSIADTPGLSAVTDVTSLTETGACYEMRDKIKKMSSGCIGVSGLRGSGKSMVIRDFCAERYGTPEWGNQRQSLPGLRLMVEAPLLYDAREFLVHLYTCLCRAVLADVRLNVTSFFRHLAFAVVPRSIRPAALLRALTGFGLLILAASLAYRVVSGGWFLSAWPLWVYEAVGSGIAFFVALAVISSRTRQALLEAREVITLAADAQERLERLHFQRTDTRGQAGTLGGPMGTSLNITSTQVLTEQAMTLPELVDDYRDFAERVVAALQAAGREWPSGEKNPGWDQGDVRLVIGIDQVDQIEDAQKAGTFLNELSSVFGTPHCVYLISVSPDTLAASDQLTPLKTASLGVFDEMVWIEPLDLHHARDLLDHGVVGLPAAFTALCYVLSGGLPRDVFRVARGIFTIHGGGEREQIGLTEATYEIIGDELRALKRRAVARAATLDVPASAGPLKQLADRNWPMNRLRDAAGQPGSARAIQDVLDEVRLLWSQAAQERAVMTGKPEDPSTAEVCDSFLAGLYFLLTVYQLFTDSSDMIAELATCRPGYGDCVVADHSALDDLARARLALNQNPYLAAALLHDTRKQLASRASQSHLIADIGPRFLNLTPPAASAKAKPGARLA